MSTHQKLPSRRFHTGPSPKLMPSWRRSSSASRGMRRASPGAARAMSITCVVRPESEDARFSRAVAPRVPAAPLHHRVARPQLDFLQVEHERDLAFEHQAQVQCARTEQREAVIGFLWWKADYAAQRAAGRRHLAVWRLERLRVDARGRAGGAPDERPRGPGARGGAG